MKDLTVTNYKSDKYYQKVVAAMDKVLSTADVVSPLQVFQGLELLDKTQVDNWRKGGLPFLEKAIKCNLSKANRILKLMRFHAHDLNMKPSITVYKHNSKILRFTKTGDPNVEQAYARCFVKIGKKNSW